MIIWQSQIRMLETTTNLKYLTFVGVLLVGILRPKYSIVSNCERKGSILEASVNLHNVSNHSAGLQLGRRGT